MLAIPVALALIAAACGDSGNSSAGTATTNVSNTAQATTTTTLQPQSGGTLTFAAYSQIAGLDPLVALGSGTSGAIQMAAVYDTLARYDADTKKYTPSLADSFTANADSTVWTIKIHPGVKFTDGTEYNAEAVKFGLNRHRVGNSIPVAQCADYVACPTNARSSSAYMGLVKDIQPVDNLTLTVTLSEPWTSFPYALASEPGMIPSPTAVKKCADPTKNTNLCDFNLKPVGAGPFMISSFKVGESIELVKNPNYWNGQVYLDGIKFVALGDLGGDKTYDALKTGTAQGAYLRVAATVAQAKKDKVTGLSVIEQAGETMLLNIGAVVQCKGGAPGALCAGKPDGPVASTPTTANATIRQAIAAAFDAKTWNDRVYQGTGLTGAELFQKSFPWDPGVAGPAFDLEKAKSLVAQAKAAGWNGSVKVLFTNSAVDANAAVALQTMLQAAGMNPVVDTSKDSVAEQGIVGSRDYDTARWGTSIGPDDSALWSLAQSLNSTAPSNNTGFKSAKADQALKDLRAAKTDDDKKAAYKTIAEEFNAQLPWLNYSAVETLKAFGPKVHGVAPSHRNYIYFDKAWMEK